jgi:hypothetical protein
MNAIKAIVVGAVASLVMALIMMVAISQEIAPFSLPPSAAFSHKLGLPAQPTGIIVHFVYGMFLSLVFVYLFRETISFTKGVGFSIVIWLVMMLVFSPIIGWGVFGLNASYGEPGDMLYLASMIKYIVATLTMHLIYGALIGLFNTWWIDFEPES